MLSILLVKLFQASHLASTAFAEETGGNQGTGGNAGEQTFVLPNPLGTTSFMDVLSRILRGLTIIAIPVVAIIVVIAGLQLITGGGNPEKRSQAKNMIVWAAIGFGVLLLADSVAAIIQNFFSS